MTPAEIIKSIGELAEKNPMLSWILTPLVLIIVGLGIYKFLRDMSHKEGDQLDNVEKSRNALKDLNSEFKSRLDDYVQLVSQWRNSRTAAEAASEDSPDFLHLQAIVVAAEEKLREIRRTIRDQMDRYIEGFVSHYLQCSVRLTASAKISVLSLESIDALETKLAFIRVHNGEQIVQGLDVVPMPIYTNRINRLFNDLRRFAPWYRRFGFWRHELIKQIEELRQLWLAECTANSRV